MIKKMLLVAIAAACSLSVTVSGAGAAVHAPRAAETCQGVVLEKPAQKYGVRDSVVKNFGEFSKGDCLTRIVHDGAVKGYFTKSVESKQYAGMTKPFDFITWTPAKGNAAGAEQKSFYVVYQGADKIYMDSDEIPAGLPTCDAKVKGQSARKYRAKVRIYGEPRRDMKVFVRTWNEIEGFTATDSYFRPGDCIMLSGAAAKHDGKDVYETTGSAWVMAEEVELIK
ncbi:hypothetical protein [Streptomyces vinaceus]|uniref:hypothetical protein n=1 Tax=Streptomyces vinaceus TaxID=1960 RepID=UPI00380D9D2F